MPSFELSKLQAVTPPRGLAETDRTITTPAGGAPAQRQGPNAPASGVSLEVGAAIDTSRAPLDNDRVAEIREALKDGSYPLIPAEIADAIIAAQISFGIEQ
ncbi:MAG: flagellar biosynthesis anti-sigma factor FlgM [Erythrobacter sp.]